MIWTYPAAGQYTVTLTVDDGQGGTNLSTKTIEVVKPPDKKSDKDDGVAGFGSIAGMSMLYWIIIVVVVIVVLVVVFMMMRNKKKQREEETRAREEAEQQAQLQAQQAQMMAQYQAQAYQQQQQYYQDPAASAQYQQQLMQQYPEQYKQMMMSYGYDEATIDQQMQAQQYPTDAQGMGMDMSAYSQQQAGDQSIPMQSATLAEGQTPGLGLPEAGITEQPQLPPAPEPVEQSEMPESPFASAETQTMEEELGADAAVAEVPIEPDINC